MAVQANNTASRMLTINSIKKILLFTLSLLLLNTVSAQEREIDASDPTKIYTFMGGGLKY